MPRVKQASPLLFPSPTLECKTLLIQKSSISDLWVSEHFQFNKQYTHAVFRFCFVLFCSPGSCVKYAALLYMGNNYVSNVNVESLAVYRAYLTHHGGRKALL